MGNLFAVLIRMGDGVYANLEYRYNKRRLDGNGKVMVRLEIVFYCVHIYCDTSFGQGRNLAQNVFGKYGQNSLIELESVIYIKFLSGIMEYL